MTGAFSAHAFGAGGMREGSALTAFIGALE